MKPRTIRFEPVGFQMAPLTLEGVPFPESGPPIFMAYDELEAFRLVFYEGLTQEEAARRMGVSRGTLWRCLENARRKLAEALTEKRRLIIAEKPF
ncbi:MAG: hypothetical protein DRO46_01510 [Candidatus Hecatellales archaeon]|nr:MAG: hypothetical protein DRO46_01510 [Candidatus Hecatellales archaeon]